MLAVTVLSLLAVAAGDSQEQKFTGKLMRRVQPERHDNTAHAELKNMAQGCQHVFLDVGSNRGVHVRAIYEASKYPLMGWYWNQSAAQSKFFEMYSKINGGSQSASNVCAFGFEANSDFAPRLQAIEQSYNKMGWRAKWLTPLAVSTTVGQLTFWREPKGEQLSGELESSDKVNGQLSMRQMVGNKVDTINFLQFLQDNILNREIPDKSAPATVVMKMDIEGAEFKVLPQLLQSGVLCKGRGIDAMTLEWHEGRGPDAFTMDWHRPDGKIGPGAGPQAAELHKQIASQGGGCQPTDVLDIDDEWYCLDNETLPTGDVPPSIANYK